MAAAKAVFARPADPATCSPAILSRSPYMGTPISVPKSGRTSAGFALTCSPSTCAPKRCANPHAVSMAPSLATPPLIAARIVRIVIWCPPIASRPTPRRIGGVRQRRNRLFQGLEIGHEIGALCGVLVARESHGGAFDRGFRIDEGRV